MYNTSRLRGMLSFRRKNSAKPMKAGTYCIVHFLGTVLEHHRETPVHFAQNGACAVHRDDDGPLARRRIEAQPFPIWYQRSHAQQCRTIASSRSFSGSL